MMGLSTKHVVVTLRLLFRSKSIVKREREREEEREKREKRERKRRERESIKALPMPSVPRLSYLHCILSIP